MKIIGISGKAGVGKDFLGLQLAKYAGYKRWSFAHTLKAMGLGFGFSYDEVAVTKPPKVREWLQTYGTEQHRHAVHEDFWVRTMDYWMKVLAELGIDRIYIPDVRFHNELYWVQNQGGKVVRLEHGDRHYPLKGTSSEFHISETALDAMAKSNGFDLVMTNSIGTPDRALIVRLVETGILDRSEIDRNERATLFGGNYKLSQPCAWCLTNEHTTLKCPIAPRRPVPVLDGPKGVL